MIQEDAKKFGLRQYQKGMQPTVKNPNRTCTVCGNDYIAKAVLQKTCSLECRQMLWRQNHKNFNGKYPESMTGYNRTRKDKDPDVWKRKIKEERESILTALGGRCIVCGATNPNWLHVDYVPTMAGTGFRHPRHKKWVFDHLSDFRILCANHHYELTITGKIEGTNITQSKKIKNE